MHLLKSKTASSWRSGLRRAPGLAAVLLMLVSISGLPALMMQGYAWWRMARDLGGLAALPQAMFDSAPCEYCRLAQKMSQSDRPEGDSKQPTPSHRQEDFRLIATVSGVVSVPKNASAADEFRFAHPASESSPRSRSERPVLPPPRGAA